MQGFSGEQKKDYILSLFNTAWHQCDCYRGFGLELFHLKYSCDHASCSDPLCEQLSLPHSPANAKLLVVGQRLLCCKFNSWNTRDRAHVYSPFLMIVILRKCLQRSFNISQCKKMTGSWGCDCRWQRMWWQGKTGDVFMVPVAVHLWEYAKIWQLASITKNQCWNAFRVKQN